MYVLFFCVKDTATPEIYTYGHTLSLLDALPSYVHRIDAEVAGAHAADDRVEVRAVAIDIAARGMDRVRNRLHLALEQPAGVRVGDHHPRDVGAEARFQGFEIHPACLGCRNVLDQIGRAHV